MPLPAPPLDSRRYQQLVDELLARAPVHTPEWTNFNASDPGVTLVQLFAFLTESLLYRANQIPERNRAKFLSLLGVPLSPAVAAKGLATIANDRAALEVQALSKDMELRAGEVPFRTGQGLDVLPIETRVLLKRAVSEPTPELLDYYKLLYASYGGALPEDLALYETVAFDPAAGPADLSLTTDRSLWIAILGRKSDRVEGDDPWLPVRKALAGRTLSLGLAPATDVETRTLKPGGAAIAPADLLSFELPRVNSALAFDADGRPAPTYRRLETRADFDPLTQPGVIQIQLPDAGAIVSWRDLDPLESGVGDLPPAIEDGALADRLITWLRVRATGAALVRLRWIGVNATPIHQYETIVAERLAEGDGTIDQVRQLSHAPVLKGTVEVSSIEDGVERRWRVIDDLLAAGPEVAATGVEGVAGPVDVFAVDAEAGRVTFGDGLTGRRPAPGARLYASYGFSLGAEGNVAAGSIKGGPLLPAGFSATNPIATWGGADAEDTASGEKQVRRYLQHRDRLVTADDFVSIAWRTPGAAIGRIEVLPAWHPDLGQAGPGSAPGVVTLMAIPSADPDHPAAPRADRPFLDALCRYLDPRRLVTTELVLRGANYRGLWISIGVEVAGGASVAQTVEAVRKRIRAYLSPLPPTGAGVADLQGQLFGPAPDPALRGWPLGQAISARAILAEAARTPGVVSVADVLLAEGGRAATAGVEISGLDLPEILGLSVTAGDPISLESLRGDTGGVAPPTGPARLPVPIVAETC
ncbi:hypothetical protein ASD79_08885 [Caulobacter sp. Root655]|uniref:baseplate J/gp47 family protein n=1 Tax=Caulobacter sp. Root655 TaxID=1736578 RepID=UPI0006FE4C0B|nr:baseplate J/gp47 family protein [Caulobacter sp. Root655]KRA60339.1 hypothetical protein ASD79_08885 [Caulobacter sp. Root655]